MLEFSLCTDQASLATAEYVYVAEATPFTYADVKAALGATTGAWVSGNAWLKYQLGTKTVYLAKKCIATQISFDTLNGYGMVDGRIINLGGVDYLCRLPRGGTPPYLNALPSFADVNPYPANALFSYAEFMRLLAPIINKSGSSAEGIPFGTSAKISTVNLGFASATAGNSTICAEHTSGAMLLRGSTDERFAGVRSRSTTSTYWGFRPLLIEA